MKSILFITKPISLGDTDCLNEHATSLSGALLDQYSACFAVPSTDDVCHIMLWFRAFFHRWHWQSKHVTGYWQQPLCNFHSHWFHRHLHETGLFLKKQESTALLIFFHVDSKDYMSRQCLMVSESLSMSMFCTMFHSSWNLVSVLICGTPLIWLDKEEVCFCRGTWSCIDDAVWLPAGRIPNCQVTPNETLLGKS